MLVLRRVLKYTRGREPTAQIFRYLVTGYCVRGWGVKGEFLCGGQQRTGWRRNGIDQCVWESDRRTAV